MAIPISNQYFLLQSQSVISVSGGLFLLNPSHHIMCSYFFFFIFGLSILKKSGFSASSSKVNTHNLSVFLFSLLAICCKTFWEIWTSFYTFVISNTLCFPQLSTHTSYCLITASDSKYLPSPVNIYYACISACWHRLQTGQCT